jgi:fermentation-respiration switch protein FrsA (DUF1100 family)
VAGDRPRDVRGVVAIAPFTSYRAVARAALRQSLVTRLLVLPSYAVVQNGHDPIDRVDRLAPTPILLVHGEKDELIPARMSKELFERAKYPKRLMLISDAGHNSGWKEMGPEYVELVTRFLRGDQTVCMQPNAESANYPRSTPSSPSSTRNR